MSFSGELLSVDISKDARGGPEFQTDVVIFGSGNESRNQNWLYHRGKWDVAFAARLPARWKILQSFFRICGGRARGFLFKDWTDYIVASGEGVLVTIDGTHKQLAKRWTFGSQTYDQAIYKPISGTVTLASGTLDYATGIVAGGAATTWTGQFYKPARFDTDVMEGTIVDRQPDGQFIMEWQSIPILETRLET